jgi:hypothetical protein
MRVKEAVVKVRNSLIKRKKQEIRKYIHKLITKKKEIT